MEILDSENLLDPLAFADGEIDVFIRDHTCFCGSHLLKKPAPERKWQAYCPACDLPIVATGYIHKAQAEKAEQNVRAGLLVMQEPVKRETKQALSELGFQ